jgi:hypothetical protein
MSAAKLNHPQPSLVTTSTQTPTTAVGRLLKPKPGQRQLHKVIAVKPDGTVRTVINRQM